MGTCTSRDREETQSSPPPRHETVILKKFSTQSAAFYGCFAGEAEDAVKTFYFTHLFDDDDKHLFFRLEDLVADFLVKYVLNREIRCEITAESIAIRGPDGQKIPLYFVRLVCDEDVERFNFFKNLSRESSEGSYALGREETKFEPIP